MLGLLKEARMRAKLRQVEVAQALGKPQSYVSKVENGERRIDPVELLAFARVYETSILSLLDTGPDGRSSR